jgi:hypothetical protein
MEKQNVDFLIKEADELLRFAKEELSRAKEDVTAYVVCHNSRKSIINYLTSFLLKRGTAPDQPITIANLMDQCREEDARFENLDISNTLCRFEEHDEGYCLSVEKVSECLNIAQLVRGIVVNPTPAY